MLNVRIAGGHLYGKLDVLDEIWDVIESVSGEISYLL